MHRVFHHTYAQITRFSDKDCFEETGACMYELTYLGSMRHKKLWVIASGLRMPRQISL